MNLSNFFTSLHTRMPHRKALARVFIVSMVCNMLFGILFLFTLTRAITFDADLVPANVGFSLGNWDSINQALYITGNNVGIGTPLPTQRLEVAGGVRFNTTTPKPTCDDSMRGTFWFTQSGTNEKDKFEVCTKNNTDTAWRTIY